MDNDGVKGDRGPIGSDRTAAEARAQGKAGPIDNDGVKGDKGPIGSDRADGSSGSSASRMLSGRGTGGMHLVLDADPQRLKRAPNFDRNQWPDWNDAKVRGDVDRAYGGAAPSGKAGQLVRASQLLDADIHDPQAKNVGEVEDLVVDTRTGNVRYAVIDFDQAWTPVDKLVAVPMKSLRATAERKELTFSGSKEQLQNAPSFDKGKWPDLNAGAFRNSVDRYSSSWRATPESANARNGTATTPGGGMTSAPTDRSRGATASRSGSTGSATTEPATGTQGGTGSR
jgi:sporulation protein YlmC with PRC-barrel domain